MLTSYTHPDVFTLGVQQGWADPENDPRRINWAPRQNQAAIPFAVVDGRPVNPCASTGIRHGRNQLGHWGEQLCADALVTATIGGYRCLLLVERRDGHGWALPGGYVDNGETPAEAAVRELEEETGLYLPGATWSLSAPRYVPDPRASDESWMVTVLARCDLGHVRQLPPVAGGDDAARAIWAPADTYQQLELHLAQTHGGTVFAAHTQLLAEQL